ncbi:hypothetical protein QYF36_023226 [Acer negundo]|nr:hypothetical protein QYF36_023226 [Acer negundo]
MIFKQEISKGYSCKKTTTIFLYCITYTKSAFLVSSKTKRASSSVQCESLLHWILCTVKFIVIGNLQVGRSKN